MKNYDIVGVLEHRFTIQILSALNQYGSMNISQLSKTVDGNARTILKRIKEMEDVGLVATWLYGSLSLKCCETIVTNTRYGAHIIRSLTLAIKEGCNA